MRSRFAIPPFLPALAFAIAVAASASAGFVACGGAEFALAPDGGEAADAGSAPVDAGAPFCPNDAYDFCADFDREALSAEWSNIANTGGAAGSENDDASVSAPNSYLAISPPLTGSDSGVAGTAHSILTELALPRGATHIGFDLRIDELSFPNASDATAAIFAVAYTQGPSYELALEFHPVAGNAAPFAAGLLEVTTIAGTTPTEKLTDLAGVLPTVGVWYRVQIDFTIDAASNPAAVPASIAVTSGSPPTTVTKLVTLTPPLGTALGARALDVGIEAFAATGETKLRFDNVTYSH
jgi:hypothetical protein